MAKFPRQVGPAFGRTSVICQGAALLTAYPFNGAKYEKWARRYPDAVDYVKLVVDLANGLARWPIQDRGPRA